VKRGRPPEPPRSSTKAVAAAPGTHGAAQVGPGTIQIERIDDVLVSERTPPVRRGRGI